MCPTARCPPLPQCFSWSHKASEIPATPPSFWGPGPGVRKHTSFLEISFWMEVDDLRLTDLVLFVEGSART